MFGCLEIRAYHFRDLASSKKYASLFGFTYNELTEYFSEEIEKLGENRSWKRDAVLNKIKETYSGYKFHEEAELVYNPISIIKCFDTNTFDRDWGGTSEINFARLKSVLCLSKECGHYPNDLSIADDKKLPLDISNLLYPCFSGEQVTLKLIITTSRIMHICLRFIMEKSEVAF